MQDADVILSMLSQKSSQHSNYVFERLYRILFNPDLYMLAYKMLSARAEPLLQGRDAELIAGFPKSGVEELIAQLRRESYSPRTVHRGAQAQGDAAGQSLGRVAWPDKLVQEVLRMLLQAIYEPIFQDSSHGYRPQRSCHTALAQVKTIGKGSNWIIEGDIQDFFGHLNHSKLRHILAKKINDGRMLNLIDKFLTAGYMDFEPAQGPLTAPTQVGCVGPMLANIYLHELDLFMETLCERYNVKIAASTHYPPLDQPHIQVTYTRYADDFVVLIRGSKALAEQIGEEIKAFLAQALHLELHPETSLVTNLLDRRIRFLDYELARTKEYPNIQLLVPAGIIREKLKPFVEGGKAIHHNARINLPLLDLLQRYNAEMSGLYHYYCLAADVSTKLGKFKYYHYSSLVKTVARKEKCSVAKVISKYGVDVKHKQDTGTRKIFGVSYLTQMGPQTLTYFNEPIKKLPGIQRATSAIYATEE